MTPNEIVTQMGEKGLFIAFEPTFYGILKPNALIKRPNSGKSSRRKKPAELVATGPNQVFSWDITCLRSPVKGLYYYLYLEQVIVGWEIQETESSEIAAEIMKKCCAEMWGDYNSII